MHSGQLRSHLLAQKLWNAHLRQIDLDCRPFACWSGAWVQPLPMPCSLEKCRGRPRMFMTAENVKNSCACPQTLLDGTSPLRLPGLSLLSSQPQHRGLLLPASWSTGAKPVAFRTMELLARRACFWVRGLNLDSLGVEGVHIKFRSSVQTSSTCTMPVSVLMFSARVN